MCDANSGFQFEDQEGKETKSEDQPQCSLVIVLNDDGLKQKSWTELSTADLKGLGRPGFYLRVSSKLF